MAEAFRIARKRVIIMVPNAWAIGIVWVSGTGSGAGTWEWGGEVPRHGETSLPASGGISIREYSWAVSIRSTFSRRFQEAPPDSAVHPHPAADSASAALVAPTGISVDTIGEKPAASSRQ